MTKKILEGGGYHVDVCAWGADLPDDQDILSLVDMCSAAPVLSDERPETLSKFLDYNGDAAASTVLW